MILAWLVGCVVPPEPEDDGLYSAAELWSGAVEPGEVAVGPVVVTSPRTASGGAFYVQDPGGGPATGLRVDVGGFASEAPPPVGREIDLAGSWSFDADGGPVLVLVSSADAVDAGASAEVVASAWTGDSSELFGVVSLRDAVVASTPDPLGRADLASGQDLVGTFSFATPGFGSAGDLVGIAVEPAGIALRFPTDWSGDVRDDPPLPAAIGDIRSGAFADGTPVVVAGIQAAPWSSDGRWTAIQDEAGDGLWIDGETWDIGGSPSGTVASWTGEVRAGPDGLRLRTWTRPAETAVATPILSPTVADGARLQAAIAGLGAVDAFGERPSDAWILDDRLEPLDDLVDGDVVTGIARDDGGQLVLCPFPP